ncbi:MAG: hypothetical protein AAB821_01290 [Patescibacteria group bacterium]
MNNLNRNILVSLVFLLILLLFAGGWWWRAQGEPEDLVGRISQDLSKFEKIISGCRVVGDLNEQKVCDSQLKKIEEKLATYEKELIKAQMATVETLLGSTTPAK